MLSLTLRIRKVPMELRKCNQRMSGGNILLSQLQNMAVPEFRGRVPCKLWDGYSE